MAPRKTLTCSSDLADVTAYLDSLVIVDSATGEVQRTSPFQKSLKETMLVMRILGVDLREERFDCLPTRRLNQDSLENLFSVIR